MKVYKVTESTLQGQNDSCIPCDVTRDDNEDLLTSGLFG